MKLLFLSAEREPGVPSGYEYAFAQMVRDQDLSGLHVLPHYQLTASLGWRGYWDRVYREALEFQPDLIFVQSLFAKEAFRPEMLQRLRDLPNRPFLFSHTVDVFNKHLFHPWMMTPVVKCYLDSSKCCDANFVCGMGWFAHGLHRKGVPRVYFLPAASCQVRFPAGPPPVGANPEFSLVLIANRMQFRNPLNRFQDYPARDRLVRVLARRYGKKFAVFGNGWRGPSAQGPVPFDQQHNAYRRGRIAIGHAAWLDIDYYCSNRSFIAIASGVPYLERYVPKLERVFGDRKDCFFYHSPMDAIRICDQLLTLDPEELMGIGRTAAENVYAAHTQRHRMRFLIQTVTAFKHARDTGKPWPRPRYESFMQGIKHEYKQLCIR